MKKGKCLICGGVISLENENISKCPICNASINYSLIAKTDKVEQLKHDALMYTINKEYKKLLIFIDNNYNNLLLEYYRMFSNFKLGNKYDKSNFLNSKLQFNNLELDIIINHMLENQDVFSDEDILTLINKSNSKDKYISILKINKDKEYEKTREKDLRELLFSKTQVPVVKEIDRTKEENKLMIVVSLSIYILLFLFVLIFTNKTLKYSLFNLLCIIPSLFLTKPLSLLIFKNNKLITRIIVFVLTIYLLTIPSLLFTNDYNLINHIIGLIKSPIEFFEVLIERMQPYEK